MKDTWFKDVTGGISDLIEAGAKFEAAKNGTFSNGGNTQMQTTYAPEYDAQNRGAPNSYNVQLQQRPLVGDEAKTAVHVDKKLLMIGGGVMLVAALVIAVVK